MTVEGKELSTAATASGSLENEGTKKAEMRWRVQPNSEGQQWVASQAQPSSLESHRVG